MPEPIATRPIPRDMPNTAPTTAAKTPRAASDVTRTDVSTESRENPTKRPDEDEIRNRAYEIYVEGGYEEGRAEEHWLAAERELFDESAVQTIKSPAVRNSP